MKPAQFEYHRPTTVEETVSLLADLEPDAELMAGNQSLGILLSTRLATPDHVIDVNRVDELGRITVNTATAEARIGALARHREVAESDALADHCPIFPLAAEQIAGPAVRNRGTVGGSLGEADPAGNYPCVLTALEGSLTLESVEGTREVAASDYFVGYMFTDRREDELITHATVDLEAYPPDRTGMAFEELKPAAQTWPTISAGAAVRVDDPAAEQPAVEHARLALANAADVPLRVEDAEAAVEGGHLTDEDLAEVDATVRDAADPEPETHADAELKTDAAAEYAKRALSTAYSRAIEDG